MADVDSIALNARMRNLALSFPALRNAAGVDPWDGEKFAEWVEGPRSQGERVTGYFLLTVWNHYEWAEKFDFVYAMGKWDVPNRKAFLRWAAAPWWA